MRSEIAGYRTVACASVSLTRTAAMSVRGTLALTLALLAATLVACTEDVASDDLAGTADLQETQYDASIASTTTTTTTTTTTPAPPAPALAFLPAAKTLTEEDDALTLPLQNHQRPAGIPFEEEFRWRRGRMLDVDGKDEKVEEEEEASIDPIQKEELPLSETSDYEDAPAEGDEDTTEPPFEDPAGEIESTAAPPTRKPRPRLRPMSRPSLAEIAKRRQESRFRARPAAPTPARPRISPPSRLQQRKSPPVAPSLSYRYRNRAQPGSKDTESEKETSNTTTTTTAAPPSPASSTTDTPQGSTTIKSTTERTASRFKPKRPSLKLSRFTRQPTTSTSTSTTAQDSPSSTTPSTTPTTTVISQASDDNHSTSTTTTIQAPKRPPVKDNKLRWSKFRFHTTISSASRTDRPTRRPPLGFTTPSTTTTTTTTTTAKPQEAPFEVTGEGQVDKAYLLQDGTKLTPAPPSLLPNGPRPARPFSRPRPLARPPSFNWERPKEVSPGGVHIFGPVLSVAQGVRNERQTKDKTKEEDPTEEQAEDITDTPSEDTTIVPLETLADEVVPEEVVTAENLPEETEPIVEEREEEVTTALFSVAPETTLKPQVSSEPGKSSTTSAATTTTTTTENPPPPSAAEGVPPTSPSEEPPATLPPVVSEPSVPPEAETLDIEYLDVESDPPIYDITVGTSVMTAGHGRPHSPVGVGQVIPVELRPEDLMPHPGVAAPHDKESKGEKTHSGTPRVNETVTDSDMKEKPAIETFLPEDAAVPDHHPATPEEDLEEVTDSEGETPVPEDNTTLPEETLAPEHRGEVGEEKAENKTTDALENENKTTTTPSPRPSGGLLGALFNILTRTERPRPERPERLPPSRFDRPRPDRFRPERPGPPGESIPRPNRKPFRPRPGLRPFRPGPEGTEELTQKDGVEEGLNKDENATEAPTQDETNPSADQLGQAQTTPEENERPSEAGLEDQLGTEEGDSDQPDESSRPRPFRPRPDRPPPRRPFRPRPRPPAGRPEFIPPRFRFTPPPPSSSPAPEEGVEEEIIEEPVEIVEAPESENVEKHDEEVRIKPESPALPPPPPPLPPSASLPSFLPPPPPPPPLVLPSTTTTIIQPPPPPSPSSPSPVPEAPKEPSIPITRPPLFLPPPPPRTEAPSRSPIIPTFLQPEDEKLDPASPPIALFDLPDPIHTITRRPITASSSPEVLPQLAPGQSLPSKPVMESGFLGIHGEGEREKVQPTFDLTDDYDNEGEPTLPPSLPNLKIIPFVAADALTRPHHTFSSEDLRSTSRPPILPPFILPERDQESDTAEVTEKPDTSTTTTPKTTTTTTTTTTTELPITTPRRTLPRRPPIIPSRRPTSEEDSTRRPFLPFRRPGERPSRPPFGSPPPSDIEDSENEDSPTRLNLFALRDRDQPASRPPFIPPRRTTFEITQDTTDTTTSSTPLISLPPRQTPPPPSPPSRPPPSRSPPTPLTSFLARPKPTTTLPSQTSRPLVSNDISNLLLQDVFGLSGAQGVSPVRYTSSQGTPKPIVPVKLQPTLPEIPDAVKDQLPLATDPVLASGLLKLSGCNIYGRMYVVKDRIPELSGKCKECRCTPVGVQCLPIC